jgi:protease-4
MTGDPIVAYPNTETGSIGVFFGKVNLKGLYDKIGVNKQALTRGRFANIDTDDAPLSAAERDKVHKEIEVFYRGFVQRVADGRKRPYDQIETLAQGRVWTGAQAKQNGLVDELGGLDRAVEMIKERAKIGASEKVALVTYPPRRSLFEYLLSASGDNTELESALEPALPSPLRAKARAAIGRLPIRALMQGGILRLMPYTIDIQ